VILHPLVENALKYGTRSDAVPLRLRLSVAAGEAGGAAIEIANSGDWLHRSQPRPVGDIGGSGLARLQRRLDLLYPGLSRRDIQAQGKKMIVRLPLPAGAT